MSDQPTIWSYAPALDYCVPGDAVTHTGRGLRRLWRSISGGGRNRKDDTGVGEVCPSADLLASVLPTFDMAGAVSGLEAALEGWPVDATPRRRVRAVIGPPGVPIAELVEAVARRKGWDEFAPPRRVDFLERPDELEIDFSDFDSKNGPVAIAAFERCFLRHERALPFVRRLLEALRDARAPVLIGCDSWAWAFLDRTVGLSDLVDQPLALAPFDKRALNQWLGSPFEAAGIGCRSAGERREAVFIASGAGTEGDEDSPDVADTISNLAAASRGNPAVALELWRRGLSVGDDNDVVTDSGAAESLWAAPGGDSLVAVPPDLDSMHHFVLHAILMHGGLERELLTRVLPFSRHDLLVRVRELANAEVLEDEGGRLAVRLAAYGAVRDALDNEGFLVDGF